MPNPQNTFRLRFFDENFRSLKDAINHHKDAINHRLYKRLIIVETAIHRVSCLNRIVLPNPQKSLQDIAAAIANKIARLTKEIKIKAS